MKKVLLSVLLITAIAQLAFPQKSFEGKVVYKISFEDLPPEYEAVAAMLPSESVVYSKGEHSRTEQGSGMGGKVIIIADSKKKEAVQLMDFMGNKVKIVSKNEEEKKEDEPEIRYLKETKEIAGYQCKKAEIIFKDTEEPLVLYYTEEIPLAGNNSTFKGLKGMALQYEMNMQGLKAVYAATEVSKEKVPNAFFAIPDEYEEMSMEEFMKMQGM